MTIVQDAPSSTPHLSPVLSRDAVDDLGSQIIDMAGRLASANCRWLLMIARFDKADGCARAGLPSTSRWLSHYCGLSRRTATDHVRVARSLERFPALAAAMSAGRLSFSHVRAISRVARRGDDELVADLITTAENASIGQLETLIRGIRTASKDEHEIDPQRLSHRWDDESYWRMSARLAPENGPLVESAIESIRAREGISAADALVRIAEIALTVLADSRDAPALRGDERAALVIHLDAARLPSAEQRPAARVDEGPGLPDKVLRRLVCAGRVRTVVHGDGGSVLDVGRSQRLVTKRQYLALLMRRRTCAYPGCESRHNLEAHHIKHWLDGGRTDLKNLLLLCRRHHHAHHDGVFRIVNHKKRGVRFFRADGALIPNHVAPGERVKGAPPIETEHDQLDPDAATTNWDGTRLDRSFAISCLASTRRQLSDQRLTPAA